MSRILCAISGVEFKVEHHSLYLTGRQVAHPIFSLPTSELLKEFHIKQWVEGNNTDIENYLYYLALFNSTNLVKFHTPAIRTQYTNSIVANNMDSLIKCLETITDISAPYIQEKLNLPQFAVTAGTNDLSNSNHWIECWEDNWTDYQNGYKSINTYARLNHQESILERLIKDHTKSVDQYAIQLANWAALAGDFEQHADYIVLNEYDKHERMADYWKRIIKACAKTEAIFEIPDVDLTDLIEHCEEHIHHGSIYANSLMTLLRAGAERKRNFLDLGDIDIGTNGKETFRILDADASVADANMLAMILSAPTNKPVEKDYPNKLAYIRAKLKYDTAQNYNASLPTPQRRATDDEQLKPSTNSTNNTKPKDDDTDNLTGEIA